MQIQNRVKIIFKSFNWIIKAIAVLIFISCNAQRNNPLDPLNPNNSLASIEGTVQTLSLPYTGISNANVYWIPGERFVTTDFYGRFVINNLNPVDGDLIITKEGFFPDTVRIIWSNALRTNTQINLNSVPKLDSISTYTEVINQTESSPTDRLVIVTKISDKDNDIDSVYIENINLNLRKGMAFDPAAKTYSIQLTTTDLNIADIEETIGLEFGIVAADIFGNKFNVGISHVTRVIKNEVRTISPANNEIVTASPVLRWNKISTGYPFSYRIQIYTNESGPDAQLIFKTNDISSDSSTYYTNISLAQRDYFWVIWLVDQFENKSRSKPAIFIKQ